MTKECSISDCHGKHKGHGYCEKHNARFARYGDPLAGPVFRQRRGAQCCIAGCFETPQGRGMCSKHYRRWKKYGAAEVVAWEYASDSRKEWHRDRRGYVVRYDPGNRSSSPNGYVYQHRHVMSEMLGRSLRNGENVHHRNGPRSDNTPENLELWASGQPAGQRVQDRVRWHLNELIVNFEAAAKLDDDPGGLFCLLTKLNSIRRKKHA